MPARPHHLPAGDVLLSSGYNAGDDKRAQVDKRDRGLFPQVFSSPPSLPQDRGLFPFSSPPSLRGLDLGERSGSLRSPSAPFFLSIPIPSDLPQSLYDFPVSSDSDNADDDTCSLPLVSPPDSTPPTPELQSVSSSSTSSRCSPINQYISADGSQGGKLYTHRDQVQFFKEVPLLNSSASLGPFVPQRMYRPHTHSDRRRYVEEVDLEKPIYFWADNPNELGIPLPDVLHSRMKRLRAREDTVFEGRAPSVSIRLEWPGYRQWSRQIPTKDFRDPPGPITRGKLAKYLAKCVLRFVEEQKCRPMEDDADQHWKIGDARGLIQFEDLILVSLHHVSMGSWQPHLRLRAPFSELQIGAMDTCAQKGGRPTAAVSSNVVLANDAFKHVDACFDILETIMGQCGLLPSDFMVEVGFVDECHERTQGIYVYCRNHLSEKIQASLVDLFHPYPYTILPLLEGDHLVGVGDLDYLSPPQDTGQGPDKGKQRADMSSLGSYSGSKNSGGNTGREGEKDTGESGGGNGNDGHDGSGSEHPIEPSSGGRGQGCHRKLCGDFESKAYCSLTKLPLRRDIQSFTTRANIEIVIETTEQSARVSTQISQLSITTRPDQPFLLDHYVIEMLPGSTAYNVRNARPRNLVGGPDTIVQTTEISGQAKFSVNASAVLGTRRATQEDILRHPIHFKYHENPHRDVISSLWEFCIEDKVIRKGQLDLEPGHRLLPGATFLQPIHELNPITVAIASYYTKGLFESRWLSQWFLLWKERGGRVGWRNFCHETTITMPILDWPDDEKLYRLPIDVTFESDDAMEVDSTSETYNHLQEYLSIKTPLRSEH